MSLMVLGLPKRIRPVTAELVSNDVDVQYLVDELEGNPGIIEGAFNICKISLCDGRYQSRHSFLHASAAG